MCIFFIFTICREKSKTSCIIIIILHDSIFHFVKKDELNILIIPNRTRPQKSTTVICKKYYKIIFLRWESTLSKQGEIIRLSVLSTFKSTVHFMQIQVLRFQSRSFKTEIIYAGYITLCMLLKQRYQFIANESYSFVTWNKEYYRNYLDVRGILFISVQTLKY